MEESIKLVFENLAGAMTSVEILPDYVNISYGEDVSIPITHEDFIRIAKRHAEFCDLPEAV